MVDSAAPEGDRAQRPLDRQIWALAGPAVLTLASEPLYLLADTAIVGRIGTEALGGLAVASAVLLFATGMLIFLTFGTAATVARLLGAGQPDEAAKQSVQGLWLGIGLGVAVALLLAVLADWLLGLFGATEEVVDSARTYLLVSLWGLPAVTLAMAGTGALRGHLDTRTPLVVAVSTNTLNVVLTMTLVLALDQGIAGAAWGTVIAKIVAAVAYSVIVVRMARRRSVQLAPDGGRIRSLAVVGRDLFIRTVALRASLTITVALAARKGTVALAAFQVGFQVWAALAYVLDALEAAAQSLVAKALGAHDAVLARVTSRRIIVWSVGCGALLGGITAVFSPVIAGWFTDDEAVLDLLVAGLWWVGLSQPLNGVAFALDGILVGAGDQRYLAVAMVGSLGVMALGAAIISRPAVDLRGLWLLLIAFMASRVVLLGVRYRTDRWLHMGSGLPPATP
ncbi:MAG: MATE family efflux transporter [Actinomycetia bacterium]|nr:MATE family efflux transporter [Actinomycetes bacterium]